MNGAAIALVAIAPIALGPLPEAPPVLVTTLCANGGTAVIEIPLTPREPSLPDSCEAQACHAAGREKSLIQRKDG
ncbi:hypothetical protein [Aurantiacibacter sediminis]|uniref:Secreted protein n=1 Tax=Aurantiacibacter sediminis TaxID=2793064 RepID=A0ABS0N470_9SPHN|nr:hypothetical protein [Aurantiacibacter sediminis]MBH5321794.1 hypothetical protein [Aurantiacibacter sediminis]